MISKYSYDFLVDTNVLGFILHLGTRMGRDGSGYRYGFLARAFRHSMLFIYASVIPDLTGYFLRGPKVPCRAGPYLIGDGGSDGIAIFYYRYWQYHVAERQ